MTDTPHHERLEWCHGCQSNVEPVLGDTGWECPFCTQSIDPVRLNE